MNKKILSRLIFGTTLLLLAACTKDEATDPDALPEGKYPLQIASVAMSVESSEQPWGAKTPQTRMSENTENGNSSQWETGDVIYAKTNGAPDAGIFRMDNKGNVTVEKATYWTKTTENVTAWLPAEGKVELADQSKKLAYLLKAVAENASYSNTINLDFKHQLAKVRVTLQGDQAEQVNDVKIKSLASCTNTQGSVDRSDASEGWITMMPATYGNTKYWEANVVPDYKITKFLINETTEGTLNNSGITPLVAKLNTITLTVGELTLQPDGNEELP